MMKASGEVSAAGPSVLCRRQCSGRDTTGRESIIAAYLA